MSAVRAARYRAYLRSAHNDECPTPSRAVSHINIPDTPGSNKSVATIHDSGVRTARFNGWLKGAQRPWSMDMCTSNTPRTTEPASVSAYPGSTPVGENGAAHSAHVSDAQHETNQQSRRDRGHRHGRGWGTHLHACGAGGVLARTARASSFQLGAGTGGQDSDSAPLRPPACVQRGHLASTNPRRGTPRDEVAYARRIGVTHGELGSARRALHMIEKVARAGKHLLLGSISQHRPDESSVETHRGRQHSLWRHQKLDNVRNPSAHFIIGAERAELVDCAGGAGGCWMCGRMTRGPACGGRAASQGDGGGKNEESDRARAS
ncbi:hypothetical protein FB451DRAFT_1168494 [Mycena latifolia]|nr:hypothetical protein FB451DRAFT_1168494 [Mycena latifolia]